MLAVLLDDLLKNSLIVVEVRRSQPFEQRWRKKCSELRNYTAEGANIIKGRSSVTRSRISEGRLEMVAARAMMWCMWRVRTSSRRCVTLLRLVPGLSQHAVSERL